MLRGAIYGLTATTIWGGMYVVSDIVLETIPPFTLLMLRLVLGLIGLAPLLLSQRASLPPITRPVIVRAMAVGLVGFGVSLGMQFIGTDLSTAVNGALVTSASPAFIVLFAIVLLGERLTGLRLLSIILATIGVLVIIDPSRVDFSSQTFTGDLFLAGAALSWGLYSTLVRKVSRDHALDTLRLTMLAFCGGLLLVIPASAIELSLLPVGEINAEVILGVLYLGFIATTVSMWMWNRAFALVDASVASLFFFAQPVSGALLGAIFLGQSMTGGLWVGGTLIALGVLIALRPERRPALPHAEAA